MGVAENMLHSHYSMEHYQRQVETLREAVGRFSGNDDDDIIEYEPQELQFLLFRHWSLYDSIFHSRNMATRLGVWFERGRTRLLNILAKMG